MGGTGSHIFQTPTLSVVVFLWLDSPKLAYILLLLLPLPSGEPAVAGSALEGRGLGYPSVETVEERSWCESERRSANSSSPRVGPHTPTQVASRTRVLRTSF